MLFDNNVVEFEDSLWLAQKNEAQRSGNLSWSMSKNIRSISSRSRWRPLAYRARACIAIFKRLRKQKALGIHGTTRNRRYRLRPLAKFREVYHLNTPLEEDRIWRSDIRPVLGDLPENVLTIWQHGFTEIMNNAIEHSAGHKVQVSVEKTAIATHMMISDDGQGIFKKIQRELGLHDERDAVLELEKGKLTTDPGHHSGEGIFFTSRMFDDFSILSGTVSFIT